MDPITMGYYAAVCAVLSAVSGRMAGLGRRLLLGAVVGALAALGLVLLRRVLGI